MIASLPAQWTLGPLQEPGHNRVLASVVPPLPVLLVGLSAVSLRRLVSMAHLWDFAVVLHQSIARKL